MFTPQMMDIVTARHNELLADAARAKLVQQAQHQRNRAWWAAAQTNFRAGWRQVMQAGQRSEDRSEMPMTASGAHECASCT